MCQNKLVLNEDIDELNIKPNQKIAPSTIVAGKIMIMTNNASGLPDHSYCYQIPVKLVDELAHD